MSTYLWQEQINSLAKKGQNHDAIEFLNARLKSKLDDRESNELLSALVDLSFKSSRHKEAKAYADAIERNYLIKSVEDHWLVLWGLFIAGSALLGRSVGASTFLRLITIKKPEDLEWEHFKAVLFGNYWHNILETLKHTIILIALTKNKRQKVLAHAWLGYSLAYAGFSFIGNSLQRKALLYAKNNDLDDLLPILLPHLAIAYQMEANVDNAFATYDEYFQKFPESAGFYRVLAYANKVNMALSEKKPIDLRNAVDRAYVESFSLTNSRNHIQIYGAHAILSILEGKARDAEIFRQKSFGAAKAVNNNLDYLIYFRFEAIIHLMSRDADKCKKSLAEARGYLNSYGFPTWYSLELKKISICLSSLRGDRVISKQLVEFILSGFATLNPALMKKNLRFVKRSVLSFRADYWNPADLLDFSLDAKAQEENKASHLTAISLKISDSEPLSIEDIEKLDLDDNLQLSIEELLKRQLGSVFESLDVMVKQSKEIAISFIEEKYPEAAKNTYNDKGKSHRISLGNDGCYLIRETPLSSQIDSQFAVGIQMPQMDLHSVELLDFYFGIIISQTFHMLSLTISQREKIEAEKTKAVQSELVQIAHDFQSPLDILENALLDYDPDDEENRIIVTKSIQRAKDLSNNLLSLRDDGEVSTKKNPINIASTIGYIVSEKRIEFVGLKDKKINLTFSSSNKNLFSNLKVLEFKRVISNIVNNAVEAIEKLGFVEIAISEEKSTVVIKIKDNGTGIEKEKLDSIFDEGISHKGSTGLGLFHAKKTIIEHNGKLEIDSTKGVGTTIRIEFPRSPAPVWYTSKVNLMNIEVIVVFDDDASVHEVWDQKLKPFKDKIKIIHCSALREFEKVLKNLKNRNETLVLSDYQVHGFKETGLDLLEKYGDCRSKILVTSYSEDRTIQKRCERLGVTIIPKNQVSFVDVSLSNSKQNKVVHIEDSETTRLHWSQRARKAGKEIVSVSSFDELLPHLSGLSKNTEFYIDQDLKDEINGLQIANTLSDRGFENLFLSTAYAPETLEGTSVLKGFVSKAPPWAREILEN